MEERGPRGHRTSEYYTWTGMRQRCRNPKSGAYKYYGARGIEVCARWNSFDNFMADMGPKPSPDHTIERENVNGNYEPDNCVWLHKDQQAKNRRSTQWVDHEGQKMCLAEALRLTGKDKTTIRHRVKRGLTHQEALETNRMRMGPPPTCQISFRGEAFTLKEFSELTGRSKSAVWYQIYTRGRSAEEVFNHV